MELGLANCSGSTEQLQASQQQMKKVYVQMSTADNTGCRVPVEIEPPLTLQRMRAAAVKKFKGKVSSKSRCYNGVTGEELVGEGIFDNGPNESVVWSGSKKDWSGARRIREDYASALARKQEEEEEEAAAAAPEEETQSADWVSYGAPYSPEVVTAAQSTRSDGVVLVWKENEKNGYLSNWDRSGFVIGDERYNCAEQWIMSNKALCCNDEVRRVQVMAASEPGAQKRIGRELNLDKQAWNQQRKWQVQLEGTRAKFRQNVGLAVKLLRTGNKPIAEASPNDRIFGIGLAPSDPSAQVLSI